MALQLTGAFKKDSLANLQVRLPAVVIGGGLTAIDTATELARVLPDPGGEAARAARDALRIRRRGDGVLGARSRGAQDPTSNPWSTAGRSAASASGRARQPARRRASPLVHGVGRRHHRLPQDPERFARLPAEPRRGDQGARGRDLASSKGSRRWKRSPTSYGAVQAVKFSLRGGGEASSCPRGPSASRRARARTPRPRRSSRGLRGRSGRRLVPLLPPGDGKPVPAEVSDDPAGEVGFFTSYSKRRARSSASSATTIPSTPATW